MPMISFRPGIRSSARFPRRRNRRCIPSRPASRLIISAIADRIEVEPPAATFGPSTASSDTPPCSHRDRRCYQPLRGTFTITVTRWGRSAAVTRLC